MYVPTYNYVIRVSRTYTRCIRNVTYPLLIYVYPVPYIWWVGEPQQVWRSTAFMCRIYIIMYKHRISGRWTESGAVLLDRQKNYTGESECADDVGVSWWGGWSTTHTKIHRTFSLRRHTRWSLYICGGGLPSIGVYIRSSIVIII